MAPFEHAIQILEYGRIREILSAYAESVLGRKLASQLRPCPDGAELRRAHAETRELGELLESARLPLAGLSDVCSGLEDNDSGGKPLEPEHLYRVVDLLRSGLSIREVFCRDEGRFPALSELGEELDDLPELRQEIPEIIDLHEGVRSEASEKLSNLRRELSSLQEKLRQGAAAMLKRKHDRRIIHIHPDDLELVRDNVAADLELVPDGSVERGGLRVETEDGGVEDGPHQWRRALAEIFDPCRT